MIWGGITAIISYIVEDISIIQAVSNGFRCLYGGCIVPFWFIITFGIIYTILLITFKQVKKYINTVLAILFAICVIINTISIVNIFAFNGFYIQGAINQRLRLWTWMFYFLLGYKIKDFVVPEKVKKRMPIILLFSTIIAIIYQYLIFVVKLNLINSSYCYESPIIMIWACLIVLTVKNSQLVNKIKRTDITQRLAKYSFGVFLMHMFFVKYLMKYFLN